MAATDEIRTIIRSGGVLTLLDENQSPDMRLPVDEVARVVRGPEGGTLFYFVPSLTYTGNIHTLSFDHVTSLDREIVFHHKGRRVAQLAYAEDVDETYAKRLREWREDLRGRSAFVEHKRYLEQFYDEVEEQLMSST